MAKTDRDTIQPRPGTSLYASAVAREIDAQLRTLDELGTHEGEAAVLAVFGAELLRGLRSALLTLAEPAAIRVPTAVDWGPLEETLARELEPGEVVRELDTGEPARWHYRSPIESQRVRDLEHLDQVLQTWGDSIMVAQRADGASWALVGRDSVGRERWRWTPEDSGEAVLGARLLDRHGETDAAAWVRRRLERDAEQAPEPDHLATLLAHLDACEHGTQVEGAEADDDTSGWIRVTQPDEPHPGYAWTTDSPQLWLGAAYHLAGREFWQAAEFSVSMALRMRREDTGTESALFAAAEGPEPTDTPEEPAAGGIDRLRALLAEWGSEVEVGGSESTLTCWIKVIDVDDDAPVATWTTADPEEAWRAAQILRFEGVEGGPVYLESFARAAAGREETARYTATHAPEEPTR